MNTIIILTILFFIVLVIIDYTYRSKHSKHFFGGKGKATEKQYKELITLEYILTQGYYYDDKEKVSKMIERYNILLEKVHANSTLLYNCLLMIKNIPSYPSLMGYSLYMSIIYPIRYPDRFR